MAMHFVLNPLILKNRNTLIISYSSLQRNRLESYFILKLVVVSTSTNFKIK